MTQVKKYTIDNSELQLDFIGDDYFSGSSNVSLDSFNNRALGGNGTYLVLDGIYEYDE